MLNSGAHIDVRPGSFSRHFISVFWVFYAFAAIVCVVAPEGRIFLGSIGMAVYWLVLLKFRQPMQRLAGSIRPTILRFFVIGIVSSDLIMENLAINFKGDLQSNLLLNSLLWLGAYLGSICGWWLVARVFRFTPYQAFFTAGLLGMIIEQNWMIPKLLAAGQWAIALIAAPVILVVYGAAVAPAFLLADLDRSGRKPGIVGFSAALVLPGLMFYAGGAVWIALLKPFIGS